jgi:hypothetical protein
MTRRARYAQTVVRDLREMAGLAVTRAARVSTPEATTVRRRSPPDSLRYGAPRRRSIGAPARPRPAVVLTDRKPPLVFSLTLLVLGLVGIVGGVLIVRRRDGGSAVPGVAITALGAVAALLAVALLSFPGVPA